MSVRLQYSQNSFIRLLVAFFMVTTATVYAANTPEELQQYLDREDHAYSWELKEQIKAGDVTVYDILLTSQKWQEIMWRHQLRLVVPEKRTNSNHALLFITGGSNQDEQPNWSGMDDKELRAIGDIAKGSGSPIAILKQVPNQPLYGDRKEDELISFTFVKYLENKDGSWPLLFPMVKSAVKAMTAVQEVCKQHLEWQIDHFVVSGGSKRGWTTWLTGAHDPRVSGIAPMVIDVLNMPTQMEYQLYVWGKYSHEIEDYEEKGLLDLLTQEGGRELSRIVDPYSYRDKISMPKLIFIGTNDPYWPVDAVKHYFDDLKGDKYIHYVPNAGHGLGDGKQAIEALAGFFTTFVKGQEHPSVKWNTQEQNGTFSIELQSDTSLKDVQLWTAVSPDRDFRNDPWKSESLTVASKESTAMISFPEKGFKAVYLDALFESPVGGTYRKSTRMFILTSEGLVDKTDDFKKDVQ